MLVEKKSGSSRTHTRRISTNFSTYETQGSGKHLLFCLIAEKMIDWVKKRLELIV